MNLIELINKYKNQIVDKSFLIEYDLFFDNIAKKYCKFAIDEHLELEKLNNIILSLKNIDENCKIYVNTYNLDFINGEIFIYADTLWIDTITNLKDILKLFSNFKEIEPSDINLLSEEEIDVIPDIVILLNNDIQDYKLFSKKLKLNKIKSLYWD